MAEHDDLFGAFLDLATKLVHAQERADPGARVEQLLLHELADPTHGAVYLGNKIGNDLITATNALHVMRLNRCYDSDDAKEKGEAILGDLKQGFDACEEKHASVRDAPIRDRNGSRVGTIINPTQEWECPCGGRVHATPEHQPADCSLCGEAYARVASGTREPLTRYAFRCWACGAGGICKQPDKIDPSRHAAGCAASFSVWPAGGPTGKREKCAEALPSLRAAKARRARRTKDGLLRTCQLCDLPIKPGDLQRVYKSRRACEACVERHGDASTEAVLDLLSDSSTADDWYAGRELPPGEASVKPDRGEH